MKKSAFFIPLLLVLFAAVWIAGCDMVTFEDTIELPGSGSSSSSPSSDSSSSVNSPSSSSSSSVSPGQNDYFSIYSETWDIDVVWDTDTKMDNWQNSGGNCVITEEYTNCGEGGKCWSFRGTGTWAGVGVRVEPIAVAYRDLRDYTNGSLVFRFRGPNWKFKIGMEDAVGTQVFVSTSQLTNYGLATNNSWCVVRIPSSVFSALNFRYIRQYFMYVSGGPEGYVSNQTYYFDDLYFSKSTY